MLLAVLEALGELDDPTVAEFSWDELLWEEARMDELPEAIFQ